MGLHDVPDGMKALTGMLRSTVNTPTIPIPSGETTIGWVAQHNLAVGSQGNIIIGLHGYQWRGSTLGPGNGQATFSAMRTFLDPDILATGEITSGFESQSLAIAFEDQQQFVEDVDGNIVTENFKMDSLPAPILTVKDLSTVMWINGTAAVDSLTQQTTILYSLYEATQSAFLRIAGVSLSRG